ncbi:MAG: hypothetical protein HY007_00085 [Candidatus Sungbacteria bacterium]|nr:hypothetical protein [Candidatus Sungbacteria bacterium]
MTTLTITIPKKSARAQELVAIPRKEYEALLRAGKKDQTIVVKRSPSFRVAKKHEAFYDALDQELTETLRDVDAGNYYGPFETADELFKHLDRKR